MIVGIVGLGLIGGSMAKAVKARTLHTVYGLDTDQETMLFSRLSGSIDAPLTEEELPACDLLLLAVRPGAAVAWTIENASRISPRTTLIDLCGVKRVVCEQLRPIAQQYGFSYIGGHPMAGKERGGFVNSSEDLFSGASMILTPEAGTEPGRLETLKNFFIDLGFSSLTFTTPEEHDRMIAYTSQLAHIASSAYVKSPESEKRRGFSAGSFKDMTRVARMDAKMWTELFLDDADYLSEELETLIGNLRDYQEALAERDAVRLEKLIMDGCDKKARAGGN